MKKTLAFISASALALGMGTALADHHNPGGSKPQAATKKAPSFMFVLSAKEAQLKPGKDGNTLLVIKKSDVDQTIEFSDRPYRIVKYKAGGQLLKDWKAGTNSFENDPPNAVLSAANLQPQVVVMQEIHVDSDLLTIHLAGMNLHNSFTAEAIVITIDAIAPWCAPNLAVPIEDCAACLFNNLSKCIHAA